ncbi:MAG: phosphoglucosamine mutase [Bacteroidetes bacterium]|nr:MAG: phosphoglucosamine mutase [Bacteroidota bacterium]
MTLIRSISGIRGTIGGNPDKGLTPPDIVRYITAYGCFMKGEIPGKRLCIVVGRDARISGLMVNNLVCGTLAGMGIDVLDIGLTTTPTVEMAVTDSESDGGIIITASHNPKQWNALKLLNNRGEFLSASDGEKLMQFVALPEVAYVDVDQLGHYSSSDRYLLKHINHILDIPLVDPEAIKNAHFSVVVDAVNSGGGIAVPLLLEVLGVKTIHRLYCEPNGQFPHNPEPLPEHLADICEEVVKTKANVGFVVDPDVDRLAIINEIGDPIGEEYTLVAVADYVLQHQPGNTVSNLSSSQALKDITEKAGGLYFASAVGEVNVVEMMKEKKAVIGGEGNGGVIYPDLHYGRDALVGIALFLSYLARSGKSCSTLRAGYPDYYISKNKIEFGPEIALDTILDRISERYSGNDITRIDGVKIHFDKSWVHLRKSNTEPIIRIYAESDMQEKADHLARKILNDFKEIINGT